MLGDWICDHCRLPVPCGKYGCYKCKHYKGPKCDCLIPLITFRIEPLFRVYDLDRLVNNLGNTKLKSAKSFQPALDLPTLIGFEERKASNLKH